jgi:hypothetical protein
MVVGGMLLLGMNFPFSLCLKVILVVFQRTLCLMGLPAITKQLSSRSIKFLNIK